MPVETPPAAIVKIEDELMRYPIKVPPFGYDHIKIQAHNYKAGGLVSASNDFNLIGGGIDNSNSERLTKDKKPIK